MVGGPGMTVGVIGLGRIGAHHARALRGLPAVGELLVADADEARAAQVAAELGATATAVDALFEPGAADAIVVATPTAAHLPLLRRAVDAGIPAFCEKPVSLEPAPLDEAIREIEDAGAYVQIGFQRRFDAGYRALRDAVAAGTLGTLLVLRAATHDPAPPPEDFIAGSGGIFRDLHSHDFDAIRFVTGREIVEVYADGSVRETAWFERHGDVDAAVATLRLDDGALAVVTGTRRDPRGYDVRLEAFGTGDSLVAGLDDRSPLRSVEPGVKPQRRGYESFLDRFGAAYRAELAAFVDAVATGAPSPCTLADARAALRVALAADRSRAERRPVAVEEVTPTHTAGFVV
ncbi:MAG TPA: Gfo/Idh/MocA family oxidoreductase [Gaiellaceae bacterium]|nr:Gfo/Idh/MocA family oxidoreductase [Gaiellaceae bacterium]